MSFCCPRLWSSCGDMGDAAGEDCFVLVLYTSCVCLGGTGIVFTPSFRPRSCAAVAITTLLLLTLCHWVPYKVLFKRQNLPRFLHILMCFDSLLLDLVNLHRYFHVC